MPEPPRFIQRLKGLIAKPRGSAKGVRSMDGFADSLQLDLSLSQQVLVEELVLDDYHAAREAREERDFGFGSKGEKRDYLTWYKDLTDLYLGRRQPKTIPWRFCSNRSLMMGMAIVEVLHARIFPAVWGEETTHWRPLRSEDVDRADRISKLMFWWTRIHARQREFFDRWTRHAIAYGRVLTELQWKVEELATGRAVEKTEAHIIPDADIFLLRGATSVQKDPVVIEMKLTYRDLEAMERNRQAVNVTKPSVPGQRALRDILPVATPQGSQSQEESQELRNVRLRNEPVTILKEYVEYDFDGDGFPEPVRLLVVKEPRLYLGGVLVSDLSSRGVRHLDLTQYMPRLDDPEGSNGLGVLEQVYELVMEIDAIFNQMTDANTLSVLRPGFVDSASGLDAQAMVIAPNKLTPLSNPTQSIYYPEFNIPTERLLLAVRTVLEFIERLTAASSYIMGKESEIVGGSGTATRTSAIVAAAAQRHAVPAERLREGAARIQTLHLDLVQKNIPPGLETRVLGAKGEALFDEANLLTSESIQGEFDAYLLPDDTLGSKETQRLLSDQLYGILMGNPLVLSDPAKIWHVTSDFALKPREKPVEPYLGPEPVVNPARDPEEEHTLILQGDFGKVRVTQAQNPLEHLLSHQNFLKDPGFLRLAPEIQAQVREFITAHIQEHQMMLQKMMTLQVGGTYGGSVGPPAGGNGGGGQGGKPPGAGGAGAEPRVGPLENPLEAATRARQGGTTGVPSLRP